MTTFKVAYFINLKNSDTRNWQILCGNQLTKVGQRTPDFGRAAINNALSNTSNFIPSKYLSHLTSFLNKIQLWAPAHSVNYWTRGLCFLEKIPKESPVLISDNRNVSLKQHQAKMKKERKILKVSLGPKNSSIPAWPLLVWARFLKWMFASTFLIKKKVQAISWVIAQVICNTRNNLNLLWSEIANNS